MERSNICTVIIVKINNGSNHGDTITTTPLGITVAAGRTMHGLKPIITIHGLTQTAVLTVTAPTTITIVTDDLHRGMYPNHSVEKRIDTVVIR